MNTISNSGQRGLSNSLAAALWTLDTAFEAAAAGATGINLHWGDGASLYAALLRQSKGSRCAACVCARAWSGFAAACACVLATARCGMLPGHTPARRPSCAQTLHCAHPLAHRPTLAHHEPLPAPRSIVKPPYYAYLMFQMALGSGASFMGTAAFMATLGCRLKVTVACPCAQVFSRLRPQVGADSVVRVLPPTPACACAGPSMRAASP
jgi:hypothetical protein